MKETEREGLAQNYITLAVVVGAASACLAAVAFHVANSPLLGWINVALVILAAVVAAINQRIVNQERRASREGGRP